MLKQLICRDLVETWAVVGSHQGKTLLQIVKPQIQIRKQELLQVYEQLEEGDVGGRIVLQMVDC